MGRCNALVVGFLRLLPLPMPNGMIVEKAVIHLSNKKGKAKPIDFYCRYCGAKPGWGCSNPYGQYVSHYHAVRKTDAEEASSDEE